ncbi:hypothetical protein RsS62_40260 [Rhizobium dioscoreae]|nr:hypothetical protein RsS62_40260 [Rhizobium dioscoreae]
MRQKAGSEDKAELEAPTSTDQAFPHHIPEKDEGAATIKDAGEIATRHPHPNSYALLLSLITAQDKRRIRAAEAEGV